MNFKQLGLVLFILLSACATPSHSAPPTIAPELQYYVDLFEVTYNKTINYSVLIGSTDGSIAYCEHNNYVMVDKNTFLEYTEHQRIELLFHEFGHCSFKRDHEASHFTSGPMNGCARSLMHPFESVTLSGCFGRFWDYYINELPGGN